MGKTMSSDDQVEVDMYKQRECVLISSPREWSAHYGNCRFGLTACPRYVELLSHHIILFSTYIFLVL